MPHADPAQTQQPATPILQVESLGKRVALPSGELVILDDISFDIARGDSVAIVGASGSGKSTLLSLMAGLDVPSRGNVALGASRSPPSTRTGARGSAASRSASCSRASSCCPR